VAPTFLDTFRVLASFEPERVDLEHAPWEEYVDWAVAQGLAPLAAYNLEYRLGGAGAPEWARDRLLSVHQAALNDNVMKLVNFKRAIDDLEGRRLVLLGAAAFSEVLYPHVAFRPVGEIRVLLPKGELDALAGFLRHADFKPMEGKVTPGLKVLTDGRTELQLYDEILGAEDAQVLARSMPSRAFGPSARRPDLEDALVVHAVLAARAGFEVPALEWLDLRELVLGAPSMGGAWSHPVDAAELKARVRAAGAERAVYCALQVVARLFPGARAACQALMPEVSLPVRAVLDRAVVGPAAELGRGQTFRGEEALRALLTGA
jgi:Uncharacterised nucleotidyltransferase